MGYFQINGPVCKARITLGNLLNKKLRLGVYKVVIITVNFVLKKIKVPTQVLSWLSSN